MAPHTGRVLRGRISNLPEGQALLSSRSMKQSLANLVRALAVLLLFVPAPLAIVGAPAAVAEVSVQIVAAEPAVLVPEEAAEATEDPWTARFLAPVGAAIGAVTVGSAAAYYAIRIRGRYRVV